MISKLRHILSERCRLSGIRGCMAAGAVTAGIAAFAVIGSANADNVSTINLETDVIPEEAAVTEAQTEKRTYSRDIDFLFDEDMSTDKAAMEKEDISESVLPAVSEDAPETEAQTEAAVLTESVTEALTESVTEAPAEEAYDEEAEEASESADEASEDSAENTAEEESSEEELSEGAEEEDNEPANESSDSVTARSSAAGGNEDNGGLSSALDLEIEDEAVPTTEYDSEEAEESAAEETDEAADAEPAADDDDLNNIPEDITLDDEDMESESENDTAPQEDAISLLELPEWLQFDESGIPAEYVDVLSGRSCAYTAEPDALMSTGKEVFQGYVAVDPDIIPYGSELYIVAEDGEVYGYAIAADTGSSVRKGRIIVDLFMNEYDDCIQWGNKTVNVYVLRAAE